jgi:hypothetical protein
MKWGACAMALGAILQTNNVNTSEEQTHYNLYTSVIYHRNEEATLPTPVLSAKYNPQKQIQTVHKSQLAATQLDALHWPNLGYQLRQPSPRLHHPSREKNLLFCPKHYAITIFAAAWLIYKLGRNLKSKMCNARGSDDGRWYDNSGLYDDGGVYYQGPYDDGGLYHDGGLYNDGQSHDNHGSKGLSGDGGLYNRCLYANDRSCDNGE